MIILTYYRNKSTKEITRFRAYDENDYPSRNWDQLLADYNHSQDKDECFIQRIEEGTIEHFLIQEAERFKQYNRDDLKEAKMYLSEAMDIIEGLM